MDKVLVQECDHYDLQTIKAFVSKVINDSKLVFDQDKTVFLKLNLLTDRKPDAFTTTHPIFTQAIIEVLQEYGCRIIVGDSPAGKLDKKRMDQIYETTGYLKLARELQVELCYDMSAIKIDNVQQVKAMHDADILINVCKMKTHTLTTFTGAVKNCFGSVPAEIKHHQHALHPSVQSFSRYLVKVAQILQPELSFMDGIEAMQGNGPGNGERYHAGLMLASKNAFALDHTAIRILQIPMHLVYTDVIAQDKQLYDRPQLIADKTLSELLRYDYQLPTSSKLVNSIRHSKYPRFEQSLCIGCAACFNSCPKQTIEMVDNKAILHQDKCIKCYCCQEICPVNAIKID